MKRIDEKHFLWYNNKKGGNYGNFAVLLLVCSIKKTL